MLHDSPVCTNNHDSGSPPELRISGQVWRGSSLGPANPDAEPSGDDVAYWRDIARGEKLID